LANIRSEGVGFIFQFYHLLQELTALENVCLPALMARKSFDFEQVKDLLAHLGLADKMLHRPQELSGGEQQRFAVARALVNKPDILLADEPTGNLDSENGVMVFDLIQKLNREQHLTVCMVSHNQDFARHAECVYCLKDGLLERIK
ncbi:MAG: ATP-binding cassette domain-containing protein, partial [Chlamydiota bacterium]|nr:ATP-binding cassette domain-containing protein [Chlamydiota bacterium]